MLSSVSPYVGPPSFSGRTRTSTKRSEWGCCLQVPFSIELSTASRASYLVLYFPPFDLHSVPFSPAASVQLLPVRLWPWGLFRACLPRSSSTPILRRLPGTGIGAPFRRQPAGPRPHAHVGCGSPRRVTHLLPKTSLDGLARQAGRQAFSARANYSFIPFFNQLIHTERMAVDRFSLLDGNYSYTAAVWRSRRLGDRRGRRGRSARGGKLERERDNERWREREWKSGRESE